MRISVRAHPGASRARLEWDGQRLHIWVTARAVDGAANAAVLAAVARALSLPPSAVTLRHGARGRDKVLEVDGEESLLARLPASGRSTGDLT